MRTEKKLARMLRDNYGVAYQTALNLLRKHKGDVDLAILEIQAHKHERREVKR